MKKAVIYLAFVVFSICTSYAQQSVMEGYDGLVWGTTIKDFLDRNPTAYEETDDEDKSRNEKLFWKDTSTMTRVYRFFDGKLYWGRTAYSNPDDATVSAIMDKLLETYGKFDGKNEGSDNDNREYIVFWINISRTFSVTLEYYENYNSYGRIESIYLFITYENEEIRKLVDQYDINQKKKNIEL